MIGMCYFGLRHYIYFTHGSSINYSANICFVMCGEVIFYFFNFKKLSYYHIGDAAVCAVFHNLLELVTDMNMPRCSLLLDIPHLCRLLSEKIYQTDTISTPTQDMASVMMLSSRPMISVWYTMFYPFVFLKRSRDGVPRLQKGLIWLLERDDKLLL